MKGWYGNKMGHSLASRGVKSSNPYDNHLLDHLIEQQFEEEVLKGNVIVWDNAGSTMDRYTVLIDGHYVFTMSHNPLSPQGFNQYAGDLYEWMRLRKTPYNSVKEWKYQIEEDGKYRLRMNEIPLDVKKAILERVRSE